MHAPACNTPYESRDRPHFGRYSSLIESPAGHPEQEEATKDSPFQNLLFKISTSTTVPARENSQATASPGSPCDDEAFSRILAVLNSLQFRAHQFGATTPVSSPESSVKSHFWDVENISPLPLNSDVLQNDRLLSTDDSDVVLHYQTVEYEQKAEHQNQIARLQCAQAIFE